MNMLKKLALAIGVMTVTLSVQAAEMLKPFVLASMGSGTVAETANSVQQKLTKGGFEVVGSYSPNAETTIIVISNAALKENAAKSELGGYGAVQRVSVTKVGNDVQVAYTNPSYLAHAYRLEGDLAGVSAQLAKVLGKELEFGSKKGASERKLRKYHYMFGMEYFDDHDTHRLNTLGSFDEAVKTVEANLAKQLDGVGKVYRVDIPGKDEVLFGVSMSSTTEKYMDDNYIMGIIDFKDPRSTAHLPYEILVSGKDVYSLYARFRIAISFPDLSMMGANSFMNIMESPEAIKKALTKVAGGTVKVDYWGNN